MLQEPNYVELVSGALELKNFQVGVVLDLIKEGATVPFIARYRKERTGNLGEEVIREIIELKDKQEKLYKAKVTAINGIEELGKMTPELYENIVNAKTLKEVEEIYKPYKSKKKTKAMIAIEKGFQIIADFIKTNPTSINLEKIEGGQKLLETYSKEEILEGCVHIISAEIGANSILREFLRNYLLENGIISSKLKSKSSLEKLNEKDTEQITKFELYKEFELNIFKLKPYQILALNRGENLGILNVKIEKTDECFELLKQEYAIFLGINTNFCNILDEAFLDGFNVLFKSVENEIRGILSEKGEDDAIKSFSVNLEALLMTKPEYGKIILAVDPGYRAGCKLAVLNKIGEPILFEKVFLHEPEMAKIKLKDIIEKNKIEVIIVGNGTGVNEIVEILQQITKIEIIIVNESGASVYSASDVANEEFPNLDVLDRGTISIGRRFIDPLSELVKIPVGSIGVGMYQHDMPETKLEEKLGYVVENVVNKIGINVNTASSYVLNHISGIDKKQAKKIYNNRPYSSRIDLKKVLSEKTYEQAIGFLRIPESKEILDNTDIHPEQYKLAKYIYDNDISNEDFEENKEVLTSLYSDVNVSTIEFIIDSYNNIGLDPRTHSAHTKAKNKIDIDSLKEGDVLTGIIRNVVAFGAFVDVGLKNDGLVHISELANEFVKDPNDFVEVGQTVKVKITGIDKNTGKIKLSMKNL